MDARADNPGEEVSRLRACVGDLVSILALSSRSSGGDAADILNALLEALVRMQRLDYAYARASDPNGGAQLECARFDAALRAPPSPRELGSALAGLLDAPRREPPYTAPDPAGKGELSLAMARLGLTQDDGWLVAASRRADFPTETDQLLLTVAAARAAIDLQEARRLGAQRYIADALDVTVTERTRQLEATAKELEVERDRLRLLLEISETLVSNRDLASLFRSLAGSLRRVVECEFIGLALPEPGGRLRQHLVDYAGGRGAITEGMVFPMEGSASGKAFRTQRLVCLEPRDDRRADPEIYTTPEGEHFYRLLLQEGVPSGYFLPLIHRGNPIAVMQLTKYHGTPLKAQSVDFLNAVASQIAVAVGNALEHRAVVDSRDQLAQERAYLREEVDRSSMFEEIVGNSAVLRDVLGNISRVAPTDLTVLITGETGTGKELVARAIHKRSARSSNAFVSVNCAAIPPSLIASELFGHEKGAFTGALHRRTGRFELAQGGTLFLDEIGELSPETQMALLRVLQEREFERVGGTQSIHADVRIIAATNRDLANAVADGNFRSDLFYRLNVFPIDIPPLRARRADIPMLAEYFMHRFASKLGKKVVQIGGRSMGVLMTYGWPGNIRELQNIIERSVIVCDKEILSVDESWLAGRVDEAVPARHPLSRRLADDARARIEEALAAAGGRVSGSSGAAARLGVPPSTLESKIRRLGIDKYRFRLR